MNRYIATVRQLVSRGMARDKALGLVSQAFALTAEQTAMIEKHLTV